MDAFANWQRFPLRSTSTILYFRGPGGFYAISLRRKAKGRKIGGPLLLKEFWRARPGPSPEINIGTKGTPSSSRSVTEPHDVLAGDRFSWLCGRKAAAKQFASNHPFQNFRRQAFRRKQFPSFEP